MSFQYLLDVLSVPPLLDAVRPILHSCDETTAALAAIIPPNQFWRWKDMWSNSLRTAVYSAALVEFLTTGSLISLAQTSQALGSEPSHSTSVRLFGTTLCSSKGRMER